MLGPKSVPTAARSHASVKELGSEADGGRGVWKDGAWPVCSWEQHCSPNHCMSQRWAVDRQLQLTLCDPWAVTQMRIKQTVRAGLAEVPHHANAWEHAVSAVVLSQNVGLSGFLSCYSRPDQMEALPGKKCLVLLQYPPRAHVIPVFSTTQVSPLKIPNNGKLSALEETCTSSHTASDGMLTALHTACVSWAHAERHMWSWKEKQTKCLKDSSKLCCWCCCQCVGFPDTSTSQKWSLPLLRLYRLQHSSSFFP